MGHLSALLKGMITIVLATGCAPETTLGARQVVGPQDHVLAGALHARTGAVLILQDAASRVGVRFADLPGLLYRVSTPADSGLAPAVSGAYGRVRLQLRPTGAAGPDTVEILLNRSVPWDLRLPAGAGEHHLELATGRLRRLDLGAGTGLVKLRLPPPRGTVLITLTGAVGDLAVTTPSGTPTSFRLLAGADRVTVPGMSRAPASPGEVIAPATWRSATDRYAVTITTPVGTVTLAD